MFFTVITLLPLQKEQFTFPASSPPDPSLSEKIAVSHMKYFQTEGGRFMENHSEWMWAQTNSPSSVLFMIIMISKRWLCQIFLLIVNVTAKSPWSVCYFLIYKIISLGIILR